MASKKPHMNLVFIGHVDHGKSTLIGRIFYDTGVLSEQELAKHKKMAEELGKASWEFAYAVDLTKEERKRGMTIDLAHKKFETDKYYFTIIDAPGHRDFIKNMITGASQADAAVLVVDAKDGVMAQTREHIHLAKVFGIGQLIIAINKMDAIKYDEKRFNEVKEEVSKVLKGIGYNPSEILFVPVSALGPDNITKNSDNMSWYKGKALVPSLSTLKEPERPTALPLRLPLQDVYSVTGTGAVPVGRIETGELKVGQKITFMPANASGEVKSIEMHHEDVQKAGPGDNVGFNVRGVGKDQIKRGDVGGPAEKPPTVAKKFTAQIIVLSHPTVITVGYTPVFHAHTSQVACKITKIVKKMDPKTGAVTGENPDFIKTGDSAIVEVEPLKPMVIEKKSEIPQLSSFAIRDMGATIGAGVCIDILE